MPPCLIFCGGNCPHCPPRFRRLCWEWNLNQCESLGVSVTHQVNVQDSSNCFPFLEHHSLRVPGCRNILLARKDYMTHYHDCLRQIISREGNRNWTVARYFPVLFTVHWKQILAIVWSSLSLKITREIALFRTAVFLAIDHVQHALHKGLHRGCGTAHAQMHGCPETVHWLDSRPVRRSFFRGLLHHRCVLLLLNFAILRRSLHVSVSSQRYWYICLWSVCNSPKPPVPTYLTMWHGWLLHHQVDWHRRLRTRDSTAR